MLENCFRNEERELYEKTTEAISYCHMFLRKIFDPSIVSLRDINRFNVLNFSKIILKIRINQKIEIIMKKIID